MKFIKKCTSKSKCRNIVNLILIKIMKEIICNLLGISKINGSREIPTDLNLEIACKTSKCI